MDNPQKDFLNQMLSIRQETEKKAKDFFEFVNRQRKKEDEIFKRYKRA